MICKTNLTVIDMFVGPIFTEGVDNFMFRHFVDPILPATGLPIPMPVRLGLFAIELQVEAGEAIASGKVADEYQYTGQAAQAERAQSLGMNLIYQPGGMKI